MQILTGVLSIPFLPYTPRSGLILYQLIEEVVFAHRGGLLGFGNAQQLPGIQGLLQDPLVADADWNQVHVKHLPFQEGLHDDVEQP